MQTVLVTIIGPHKTCDLELPGDVPINDLLPFLMDICLSQAENSLPPPSISWCLRMAEELSALTRTSSLIEAGVVDGVVLHLQANSSLKQLQQPDTSFKTKTISPGLATGGIGVSWDKEGLKF